MGIAPISNVGSAVRTALRSERGGLGKGHGPHSGPYADSCSDGRTREQFADHNGMSTHRRAATSAGAIIASFGQTSACRPSAVI